MPGESVLIKWDTLDVRYLSMDGNAVELKWVDSTQYGEVFSEAETIDPYDNQVDSNSANDFTTTMVANAATANAQAYTVRSDTTLSTNAASHAGVGAPAPAYNFADYRALCPRPMKALTSPRTPRENGSSGQRAHRSADRRGYPGLL